MQSTSTLSGIIPIPVTTFTKDGELDLDGLRSQVEFCLAAGAHGLLYPGVVSEFYTLTDDERRAAVEACVHAVDQRVPVVVGVSATSTTGSVEFTRHAASLGAAAVMTMTPFVQHFFLPSNDMALRHVEAVARAADVPIILQNARIGHPMGLAALSSVAEAVPQVLYVKQETNPPTQELSDVVATLGDRLLGVFGGIGGVYLVNELDRGAVGSMPSPAFVDRIVEAYAAYHSEGAGVAQRQLDLLGSLFTRELLYNVAFVKEVLCRRGVITTPTVRIASPELDEADSKDLDRMMRNAELGEPEGWAPQREKG